MTRLTTSMVMLALALAGCGKKDDGGKGAAAATTKIEHGKAAGHGTGGGDKKAAGSKDGVRGSGQPTAAGSGTAAAPDPAVVQRGAYLANLGGCGTCHMPITAMGPDLTRPFAGGLEVTDKLPGGGTFTWRASNITPDRDTGIGTWTADQIAAAIRQGVRPDGRRLAPIMPYQLYNRLTDADVTALVTFLRALPPVANPVAPIDNAKLLAMVPPVPPAKNEPVADDPVARGAYLASLMHCAMCHTPMGPQGPDSTKAFAGGLPMELPPIFGTGILYSANITADAKTGIGAWRAADIVTSVRTATRPDGRPILGPMAMYVPMWSQLTDADAADLAAFVKAIPAVANPVPPSTFEPAAPPPGAAPPAPAAPASSAPAKGP